MKIWIDPGHGGSDPGAVSQQPTLVREADIVLSVGLMLREELRGHEVLMTRERDEFIGIGVRQKMVREQGGDLFLSIHCNAHTTAQAHGYEAWWSHMGGPGSPLLAADLLSAFAQAFPQQRNRGPKENDWGVLSVPMPAVLFELEFISNPAGRAFLLDEDSQQGMAHALADGLVGDQVGHAPITPALDATALLVSIERVRAELDALDRQVRQALT